MDKCECADSDNKSSSGMPIFDFNYKKRELEKEEKANVMKDRAVVLVERATPVSIYNPS